jgi:hypothetical protein
MITWSYQYFHVFSPFFSAFPVLVSMVLHVIQYLFSSRWLQPVLFWCSLLLMSCFDAPFYWRVYSLLITSMMFFPWELGPVGSSGGWTRWSGGDFSGCTPLPWHVCLFVAQPPIWRVLRMHEECPRPTSKKEVRPPPYSWSRPPWQRVPHRGNTCFCISHLVVQYHAMN